MNFHPEPAANVFVDVVLPIATPKPYTYHVPEELIPELGFGKRVEVQFGRNRLYSGLVIEVHDRVPEAHFPKPLLSIIDEHPVITIHQLKFWQWMADYYCCSLGEIMQAALPANLKLVSETRVIISPVFNEDYAALNDKEYLIAEALSIQEELSIEDIRAILGQKTVYPLIRSMLEKKVIFLKEDLKEKYSIKKVHCVRLEEPYRTQRELLEEAFEKLSRSTRQVETLMAYIQLARTSSHVRRADVCKKAGVDSSVIQAMVKKGVIEVYEREISRLGAYEQEVSDAAGLSEQQAAALDSMRNQFKEKQVVLLHGVTGSGKTRIYIELIQEALKRGEQVLYLLPEIALTGQITNRLQKVFGDDILVYHSRLNNNERVEIWKKAMAGTPVILGPRSALFLPLSKLKLVIVDEEHDSSYKQQDPNPRYNGRDAAVYLAHLQGAKVVLGTATPSVETYSNAQKKKYGLVELSERYGGIQLPKVKIINAGEQQQRKNMLSHFTQPLIQELKDTLERGDQAILFQNRRGYAPVYRCTTCGWNYKCIHCDVSLTYHKFHANLKCHYCGYQAGLPPACPACGSKQLSLQGFGTEKIEDELKIFLPDARIGRMDYDTARTRNAHAKIIHDFEEGKTDILVGTQMVTKGLDFENVGLVAVLSADQLLQFPDFRAAERGFQLMVQVSGRAGRRHKQGQVLIQAYNTSHPVLNEVLNNDFTGMYQREYQERQQFHYPPFCRLIRITLKHKKPQVVNEGARVYNSLIKPFLGDRVQGPAMPYISRIRTYYLLDFLVKMGKDPKQIQQTKAILMDSVEELHKKEGLSGVRVSIDVDPY